MALRRALGDAQTTVIATAGKPGTLLGSIVAQTCCQCPEFGNSFSVTYGRRYVRLRASDQRGRIGNGLGRHQELPQQRCLALAAIAGPCSEMTTCTSAAVGVIVSVMALGWSPTVAVGLNASGLELLSNCEQFERTASVIAGKVRYEGIDAAWCFGFFSAIIQLSGWQDDRGAILKLCPPNEASTSQYIRIFTQYARTHPEQLHEDAGLVVWRALHTAFPCPQ